MFGVSSTKYNQCTQSGQGWEVVGGIVRNRGSQSDRVTELDINTVKVHFLQLSIKKRLAPSCTSK